MRADGTWENVGGMK
ncbi:hypothetical protein [Escherichia coli]